MPSTVARVRPVSQPPNVVRPAPGPAAPATPVSGSASGAPSPAGGPSKAQASPITTGSPRSAMAASAVMIQSGSLRAGISTSAAWRTAKTVAPYTRAMRTIRRRFSSSISFTGMPELG